MSYSNVRAQTIAAAETKRTRQTAAMQEANALIEKTEKLLQAKEAELKKLTDEVTELRATRTANELELQKAGTAAHEKWGPHQRIRR